MEGGAPAELRIEASHSSKTRSKTSTSRLWTSKTSLANRVRLTQSLVIVAVVKTQETMATIDVVNAKGSMITVNSFYGYRLG
jgi:hypothetical protein